MSKGLKIFLIILAVVVVVFIIRRMRKPDSSQNYNGGGSLPIGDLVGDAANTSKFSSSTQVNLTNSGNEVKALQIILKYYYGAGINVDGSFGSGTLTALNNIGFGAPISPRQLWGELPGNKDWLGLPKPMPEYLNQLEVAIINFDPWAN